VHPQNGTFEMKYPKKDESEISKLHKTYFFVHPSKH
jgi:hypothetical protein